MFQRAVRRRHRVHVQSFKDDFTAVLLEQFLELGEPSVVMKRIDDFELPLDDLAVLKVFGIENFAAGT